MTATITHLLGQAPSFRHRLQAAAAALTADDIVTALFTDEMTGLYNRRAFGQRSAPMVAIVDLDSLKWLNDARGHQAGDAALIALACGLVKAFGADRCFRLAGDEFAVIGNSCVELHAQLVELRKHTRGFSFGIGRDLAGADAALSFDKSKRERSGLRASRGERPPWAAESGA